jgi:hypothetical protein
MKTNLHHFLFDIPIKKPFFDKKYIIGLLILAIDFILLYFIHDSLILEILFLVGIFTTLLGCTSMVRRFFKDNSKVQNLTDAVFVFRGIMIGLILGLLFVMLLIGIIIKLMAFLV